MVERISGCRRHFAIGRNLSFGDRTNDAPERGVPLLIVPKRVLQDSTLEIWWNCETSHSRLHIAQIYSFAERSERIPRRHELMCHVALESGSRDAPHYTIP